MGVFETLAEVCPPADLARIRDGMREFLSVAGSGARENRRKLVSIAERMLPLERRYLPALNVSAIEKLPCETLVAFIRPEARLHVLAAAVLRPRRLFALHLRGDEDSTRDALRPLEDEPGMELVPLAWRPDDVERECERLSERILKDRLAGSIVFFPNDGPGAITTVLTLCAQQFSAPVIFTEVETYGGVERPFSLRLNILGQERVPASAAVTPPAPGAFMRASQPGRFAYPSESPVLGKARVSPSEPSRAPAPAPEPPTVPSIAPPVAPPAAAPPSAASASTEPVLAPAPAPAPESALPLAPTLTGAEEDLAALLIDSFNAHNYAAAERIATLVAKNERVLRRLWIPADVLSELIRVYADWDRFRHSPTRDDLSRRLHDRLIAVWQRFGPARNKLVADVDISRNAAFLRALQTSWKLGGRIIGDSGRMVDYFAAGIRRRERGHHDTAVACFMRSLELAAIYALHSGPFKVGDPLKPDYTALLELFGNYNEMAERTNEILHQWDRTQSMPVREAPLSLSVMMALLESAGRLVRESPALAIGARFRELMSTAREDEEPLGTVVARAVAAGATSPLDEEECARMEKAAREIVSRAVGMDAFRKLLAAATHPALTLPGGP